MKKRLRLRLGITIKMKIETVYQSVFNIDCFLSHWTRIRKIYALEIWMASWSEDCDV